MRNIPFFINNLVYVKMMHIEIFYKILDSFTKNLQYWEVIQYLCLTLISYAIVEDKLQIIFNLVKANQNGIIDGNKFLPS